MDHRKAPLEWPKIAEWQGQVVSVGDWVMEPKRDGGLLQISRDWICGRRTSSLTGRKIEYSLPCFRTERLPPDTLLFGEFIVRPDSLREPYRDDFKAAQRILLSGGTERPVGEICLFDLAYVLGEDARRLAFRQRRAILAAIFEQLGLAQYGFLLAEQSPPSEEFFERVVSGGGEGVIYKRLDAPFGQGALKRKRTFDYTVLCDSFERGAGRCANVAGSFAMKLDGRFVGCVGSGFSDAERVALMAKIPFKARVRCEGWTSGGKLWHPSFLATVSNNEPLDSLDRKEVDHA